VRLEREIFEEQQEKNNISRCLAGVGVQFGLSIRSSHLKNLLVLLLESPIRYAPEFGFCKQGFLENCRGLQLRGRGLARFRKNIPQLNSVVVLMQPAHRTNLGLNIKRLFMRPGSVRRYQELPIH
jgi:hypothetical protein